MATKYVRSSAIREMAKRKSKRVSKGFILALDACVQMHLDRAIRNSGPKVTLKDDDLVTA
jgi:hypothetical protein